jgi:hypothetical protein
VVVKRDDLVRAIVSRLASEAHIEGAFLAGSLVNEFADAFSDVDLGIASLDTAEAFEEAYRLRHELLRLAGEPLTFIERGWEHCQMIAALFGKSRFPPAGLEIDLVFSQLMHVTEQMPYTEYRVVFDRRGALAEALGRMGQVRPRQETEEDLQSRFRSYLFALHDAVKACERGDAFQLQTQLEVMRGHVFFAAALRRGADVYGSKRAYRYLSADERHVVQESYAVATRQTIERLGELFLTCVDQLDLSPQMQGELERFGRSLHELM